MITLIILIAVAMAAIYYHLSSRKKFKLPPGPVGIPFVGNVLALLGRPDKTCTKWMEQYGDIFYLEFAGIRVVILGSVQLIKDCFNDPVFNGRPGEMNICVLSRGQHGLISSEGQEWAEQKRFTLRHLRDFGFGKNRMEGIIMEEVNDFNSMLKSDDGNHVTINSQKFERLALNALWVILTGNRFQHGDEHKMEILQGIHGFLEPTVTGVFHVFAPSILRMVPKSLNSFERTADELHKMLKEIIQEHEDTLPDEGNPRDFIDAYLHHIKKTEDADSSFYKEAGFRSLLAVIGDMFFAGADTSSSTLAWSVLYLAMNPDIQKKLQDEIDEVVGESRQVSLADRLKLPYSEATIQEVFRKSSITVIGMMHTAMQDATFAGYDIPKGTWIVPNIHAIHHNPKIWGDPQNFRPERFLSEDAKTFIKSETVLPFSLGKRICIGETLARDEIFLFITNIFQRFSFSLDASKPRPTYESKTGFLLHPQDFSVIVKERV